jgi:hypothetical protein
MSSLATYYDSTALWSLAVASTTYMGVGMAAAWGSSQHWLSDTVAGALIGYSIGSSVGEGFRQLHSLTRKEAQAFIAPLPIQGGIGIRLSMLIE